MQDLMKANCYDAKETMIIVGSCLAKIEPQAYKELKKISNNIFDVCLESTHLNMVITKVMGMLCRVKIKKLVFASVDRSPHCIQLHYIENELRKAMNLNNIEIIHYVAINNELIEITNETINKSKALSELQSDKILN